MNFPSNEDCIPSLSLNAQSPTNSESWGCPESVFQELLGTVSYSSMNLAQYLWDETVFDTLTGMTTGPSYTHLPQTPLVPRDPPHPQVPIAQQTSGPPSYDRANISHTADMDVGVGPNAVEEKQRSTRERARRSQESDLIDEIRTIIGMEYWASKLEVLNAAAKHLGCVATQATPGVSKVNEQMKLAYGILHERTGRQGRLKRVRCLELVIKALTGQPTLDPIFVSQPSGST